MKETKRYLIQGIVEILIGIWILFTGVVTQPILIEVALRKTIVSIIYALGTVVGSIYFTFKGLISLGIIKEDG